MEITGGCFCRSVRYRCSVDAPPNVAICHCSECRRSTGGTHVTWLTVPRERLRWLCGTPRQIRTNATTVRHFCSECGTQLSLETTLSPSTIDLTVSSADHPERLRPDRHIWVRNRLEWVSIDDGLRREDEETLD